MYVVSLSLCAALEVGWIFQGNQQWRPMSGYDVILIRFLVKKLQLHFGQQLLIDRQRPARDSCQIQLQTQTCSSNIPEEGRDNLCSVSIFTFVPVTQKKVFTWKGNKWMNNGTEKLSLHTINDDSYAFHNSKKSVLFHHQFVYKSWATFSTRGVPMYVGVSLVWKALWSHIPTNSVTQRGNKLKTTQSQWGIKIAEEWKLARGR